MPLTRRQIRQKVFHGVEAIDVADFVEDGQAEILTDAGSGLEQGVIAFGNFLGELLELSFDGDDLSIEVADHGELVLEGEFADRMIFMGQELLFPGIAIETALRLERGPVVRELMRTEPGQEINSAQTKKSR